MPWYDARMGGLPHSTLSLCRCHVLLAPPVSHIRRRVWFMSRLPSSFQSAVTTNSLPRSHAPSITSSHYEHISSTHISHIICAHALL